MSRNTKDIIIHALKNSHNFIQIRYTFECCFPIKKQHTNKQVECIVYAPDKILQNHGNPVEHGEVNRILYRTSLFINDASIDLVLYEVSKELGIKFRKTEYEGVILYHVE